MTHLFISHSSRDGAAIAQPLAAALESAGHRCWIAPRDVKPGVPYPGQIVKAIEQSAGLVLIVTPAANDSPDVLQEIQLASTARRTIAPVIVAGCAPGPDLRYYLGVRHQVPWADVSATTAELLRSFPASSGHSTHPADQHVNPNEGRAHALLRSLGLEIVAGQSTAYPKAIPGPSNGYRYWATYLKSRRIIQLGAECIAGEIDPSILARLQNAGYEPRPNRNEAFKEISSESPSLYYHAARQIIQELRQLLKHDQVPKKSFDEAVRAFSEKPVSGGWAPSMPAADAPDTGERVDLFMLATGPNKINVIKVLREYTGWGLAETKQLVEGFPPVRVGQSMTRNRAQALAHDLAAQGASLLPPAPSKP